MNHQIAAPNTHRGLAARQKRAPPGDPITRTVVTTIVKTAVVSPTTATPLIPVPTNLTPIIVVTPTTSSVVVIPPRPSSTPVTSASKPAVTHTPEVVIASTTSPLPSASSAAANAIGAKPTGGTIAGGVIGGLLGAAALGALIFFFIRRYRRKLMDQAAFNASTFRRSALLLSDPPVPPEKGYGSSPSTHGLNPQQKIQVPSASTSSPYADSPYYNQPMNTQDAYGAYIAGATRYNQSQYGTDGQISRDPFAAANNQYGGNISGSTFGHANYGQGQQGYFNGIPLHTSSPLSPGPGPRSSAPSSPYQPQYAQQPYGRQPQYAPQQHQMLNEAPFTAAQVAQDRGSVTTAAHALAAARIAAASARVGSTSPSPSNGLRRANSTGACAALERANSIRTGAKLAGADSSTLRNNSGRGDGAGTTANQVLSRNASQRSNGASSPPPAYQDSDGKYANLQRDVKVNPNATPTPAGSASEGSSNQTATQPRRPLSSHTVYDPADAYGGF